MKAMKFVFILIWWISFAYLMINLGNIQPSITLMFFALFVLTVLNNFSERIYRKETTKKIVSSLNKIDLTAVDKKIRSLKRRQRSSMSKYDEFDKKLKALEKEREKKYRELVRKVLNLDNQLSKKYKTLAEAVVKINRKLSD